MRKKALQKQSDEPYGYSDAPVQTQKRKIKEIDIFGDGEKSASAPKSEAQKSEPKEEPAPDEDYKEPEIKLYNKGQTGFAELLDKNGKEGKTLNEKAEKV
ncbi:MAG: hypothetical protein L6V93_18400 [Clostridiales bacterium]|nr:MAG: hypothetical protein L6V93_18400 [Clostridiales bacterium]